MFGVVSQSHLAFSDAARENMLKLDKIQKWKMIKKLGK